MIEHESHCVGCPGMGLPCIGELCQNHDPVAVVSCDQCGDNAITIYQDGDDQLCARCLAIKHKADFIAEYADSFAADHFEPVES